MSVYIIGEIGINANGSLELAKRLIHDAKACGANAVKFQKRTLELVYSDEELKAPRQSPFGTTNWDLKNQLEFSYDDYCEIDKYCKELQIEWSASCWDTKSVDFLMEFNPPWIKIPSALITNQLLLTKVFQTGKPTILSTGMSTMQEIDMAVRYSQNYTLLHATSTYPCPIEELNLSCIPNLKYNYHCPVGFSSHSVSPWVCLMAACLGAEVIEAHFTLDRTMFGSDQSASLEAKAFGKMVTEIRTFEKAKGDGSKKVYDSELPIKAKLRR